MSTRTFTLPAELYKYLLAVSLREPDILRELRAETASLPAVRMQISPEQGQLMAWLIKLMGARKCLEIGVFTGYSSLAVALALPEGGELVACDVSAEWTAIAERYWAAAGVGHKITLRLQPALKTLDELAAAGQGNTFDFAFIDADKANYLNYYERTLALLRPGGVVAIDNTLWSGRVADPDAHDPDTEAIRACNTRLAGDERVDLTLIPIGDGLTLARKR